MLESLDLYCERLGPGLLAEPVNAVTNAAFLAAAWLAWRTARARGKVDLATGILAALVVAIGLGSTLFHTFAAPWARLLDELPILLFQLLFLWSYARRAMGVPRAVAASVVTGYLALALHCRGFGHLFNGSLVYAPALVATSVLGVFHLRTRACGRWRLAAAALTLALAVLLRTVDAAVCEVFPLGTHFMWHLLVALVAALCLRALPALHPPRPAPG